MFGRSDAEFMKGKTYGETALMDAGFDVRALIPGQQN